MFTVAADTIRTNPTRLLKPVKLLAALRPVTLSAISERLTCDLYMYQAIELLNRLFPENTYLPNIDVTKTNWYDVFATVLNLIEEQDWFWIDWSSKVNGCPHGTLDYLWEMMWNSGEVEIEHDIAAYLNGIPVRCFGFTETDIEECEGLTILRGLVSDEVRLPASTLADIGLFDNLTEDLMESIKYRCMAIDWSDQPEPLCWLGEMVAIAARATGNLILDYSNELYGDWWPERFDWRDDLDALREAWPAAKPVALHQQRFREWLWEDEDNARRTMTELMLGVIE